MPLWCLFTALDSANLNLLLIASFPAGRCHFRRQSAVMSAARRCVPGNDVGHGVQKQRLVGRDEYECAFRPNFKQSPLNRSLWAPFVGHVLSQTCSIQRHRSPISSPDITGSLRQSVSPYSDKIGLRGRSKAPNLQLTDEAAFLPRQSIVALGQEPSHLPGMSAGTH
jgi:hypothetical protein